MSKTLSMKAEDFIRKICINNKTNSRDIRRGEVNGRVMVGGISLGGDNDFFYWDEDMLEYPKSCNRLPSPPDWWYSAIDLSHPRYPMPDP